jgi:hypothetical protein
MWLLRINNVDDVPAVKFMKNLENMLQNMCGIRNIPHDGALGHKFYINSLSDIIRQVNISVYLFALGRHIFKTLFRKWPTLVFGPNFTFILTILGRSSIKLGKQSTG